MIRSMKLYIDELWISPYTYTVFCALREKQLNVELQEVAFAANRSLDSGFSARCPTDLIPLLEDDGFSIFESSAILEYLEDKYPAPQHPSILPSGVRERAEARMLMSWYRCGFHALRNERSTETVFYESNRMKLPPLSAAALDEAREWFVVLERTLKPGTGFLFGTWSIADTETALMLHRLIRNGDEVSPRLRDYAESLWQRPSMREFVVRERKPFRSYYA